MKWNIFLASAELFSERTFPRVSMRDIADKVGIRASSIYNHYPSKEAILEDILQYYLDRELSFHEETEVKLSNPHYRPKLDDLNYVYNPEELSLMFWITRIIYTEQFTSEKAADSLFRLRQQRNMPAHLKFLDCLIEQGFIKNDENCVLYAEMLMRMAISFQLDFLHPEADPAIKNIKEMYIFIMRLILNYEGTLERLPELL